MHTSLQHMTLQQSTLQLKTQPANDNLPPSQLHGPGGPYLRQDEPRRCQACGKTKTVRDFSVNRYTPSGVALFRTNCKPCQARMVRTTRRAVRERTWFCECGLLKQTKRDEACSRCQKLDGEGIIESRVIGLIRQAGGMASLRTLYAGAAENTYDRRKVRMGLRRLAKRKRIRCTADIEAEEAPAKEKHDLIYYGLVA